MASYRVCKFRELKRRKINESDSDESELSLGDSSISSAGSITEINISCSSHMENCKHSTGDIITKEL